MIKYKYFKDALDFIEYLYKHSIFFFIPNILQLEKILYKRILHNLLLLINPGLLFWWWLHIFLLSYLWFLLNLYSWNTITIYIKIKSVIEIIRNDNWKWKIKWKNMNITYKLPLFDVLALELVREIYEWAQQAIYLLSVVETMS